MNLNLVQLGMERTQPWKVAVARTDESSVAAFLPAVAGSLGESFQVLSGYREGPRAASRDKVRRAVPKSGGCATTVLPEQLRSDPWKKLLFVCAQH